MMITITTITRDSIMVRRWYKLEFNRDWYNRDWYKLEKKKQRRWFIIIILDNQYKFIYIQWLNYDNICSMYDVVVVSSNPNT